jgi:hypothetical protein
MLTREILRALFQIDAVLAPVHEACRAALAALDHVHNLPGTDDVRRVLMYIPSDLYAAHPFNVYERELRALSARLRDEEIDLTAQPEPMPMEPAPQADPNDDSNVIDLTL